MLFHQHSPLAGQVKITLVETLDKENKEYMKCKQKENNLNFTRIKFSACAKSKIWLYFL